MTHLLCLAKSAVHRGATPRQSAPAARIPSSIDNRALRLNDATGKSSPTVKIRTLRGLAR